jgi:hypothetical protein
MKKEKIGAIWSAVVIAGLFLAATAWGADGVKFGYSGPLSGGAAKYGKNCEAGMIMAMEEINAKGGITVAGKKYKVEVVSWTTVTSLISRCRMPAAWFLWIRLPRSSALTAAESWP